MARAYDADAMGVAAQRLCQQARKMRYSNRVQTADSWQVLACASFDLLYKQNRPQQLQ